jgi:hypothetical protein
MNRGEYGDEDTLVGMDSLGSLSIDCYIRSNLSRVSERQVEVLLERLRELQEEGLVVDYETRQWPPKRHSVVEPQAAETTRSELFAKLESWADQRGYSLAPAFERRQIHSSLLGEEEPQEEIRVPIVTLVLSDEATEATPLSGVVPYTTDPDSAERRTYTVDTWLQALEAQAQRDGTTVQASASVRGGQ